VQPRRLAGLHGREGAAAGVELGEQSRQLAARGAEQLVQLLARRRAGQRAQYVDKRRERHALAAELDARAGQDARPGGGGCTCRLVD
jgi:hypothetical protein